MQKLNLSALKKQPVDASVSVSQSTQSSPGVVNQAPPIVATPVVTPQVSSNPPVTSQKIHQSDSLGESKGESLPLSQGESTEIIKITPTSTAESQKSVPTVAVREFFPNLGVESNLLDDLTGIKPPTRSTVSSDLKPSVPAVTHYKEVVSVPSVGIAESRAVPVSHVEIAAGVQVHALPPETLATTPEQVAKDLSVQRVGGLGLLSGKKKLVFSVAGLIVMALAGVAVLNFLPTTEMKTSVVEGEKVAVVPVPEKTPEVPQVPKNTPNAPEVPESTPVVPEIPKVPEKTPEVPVDPVVPKILTASGSEISAQSGTTLSQSGVLSVNTTGGSIEPTGSGGMESLTSSVNTGAISPLVNTSIETEAFTGTRVINFRTPNGPREKK